MTCHCCNEAREAPKHHRFFADGCLYCAARRIQYLQRTLRLSETATRERCRTALAQAMALGLPEGFSRVDMFLDCLRNHIAAGCPTEEFAVRRIWPAYELEAGERGRWVLAD